MSAKCLWVCSWPLYLITAQTYTGKAVCVHVLLLEHFQALPRCLSCLRAGCTTNISLSGLYSVVKGCDRGGKSPLLFGSGHCLALWTAEPSAVLRSEGHARVASSHQRGAFTVAKALVLPLNWGPVLHHILLQISACLAVLQRHSTGVVCHGYAGKGMTH